MYEATKIISKVKELQKKYPEAVYKFETLKYCSYMKGLVKNGPKCRGCIVGQAIKATYPSLYEKLKKWEGSAAFNGIDVLIEEFKVKATKKQIEFLMKVQTNQDASTAWGEC